MSSQGFGPDRVDQDGSKPKNAVLYLTDAEWANLLKSAKARGIARNTLVTKLAREHLRPNERYVPPPVVQRKSRRRGCCQ